MLENKALRLQNEALKKELEILRRFRALVGRASEIVVQRFNQNEA